VRKTGIQGGEVKGFRGTKRHRRVEKSRERGYRFQKMREEFAKNAEPQIGRIEIKAGVEKVGGKREETF